MEETVTPTMSVIEDPGEITYQLLIEDNDERAFSAEEYSEFVFSMMEYGAFAFISMAGWLAKEKFDGWGRYWLLHIDGETEKAYHCTAQISWSKVKWMHSHWHDSGRQGIELRRRRRKIMNKVWNGEKRSPVDAWLPKSQLHFCLRVGPTMPTDILTLFEKNGRIRAEDRHRLDIDFICCGIRRTYREQGGIMDKQSVEEIDFPYDEDRIAYIKSLDSSTFDPFFDKDSKMWLINGTDEARREFVCSALTDGYSVGFNAVSDRTLWGDDDGKYLDQKYGINSDNVLTNRRGMDIIRNHY